MYVCDPSTRPRVGTPAEPGVTVTPADSAGEPSPQSTAAANVSAVPAAANVKPGSRKATAGRASGRPTPTDWAAEGSSAGATFATRADADADPDRPYLSATVSVTA